jgi:hypothetical protein
MSLSPQLVTLEEFRFLLEQFRFMRQIRSVHLHSTTTPSYAQYQGAASIAEMWQRHIDQYGLQTIAQHLTIAPDGALWLGRNWNLPPASAAGQNGDATTGPLMLTLVGNFAGEDSLNDAQRQATVKILALLLHHFDLANKEVRFFTPLDAASFGSGGLLQAARKAARVLSNETRTPAYGPLGIGSLEISRVLENFAYTIPDKADPLDAELSEDAMNQQNHAAMTNSSMNMIASAANDDVDAVARASSERRLPEDVLDELRPYLINLNQGRFSTDGEVTSSQEDVDTIFEEHLMQALAAAKARNQKLKIVFYAHGGLVSEANALEQAARHVPWWLKNNIYPIYFIWETGLLETIGQLAAASQRAAMVAGAREALTDGFVEGLVRSLGGPRIWLGMKQSAQLASDKQGGARYAAQKLKAFCADHGGDCEIYAVGHSAGAIFHSHFVPMALELGVPAFQSLFLLAPAVTVQGFHERLAEHMGKGIERTVIFTLRKDLDLTDTTGPIYHKSILYLIANALEAQRRTPLLGLEASIRADNQVKRLFGLGGQQSEVGEIIWADTATNSGRSATRARHHVDFGGDAATLNSLLRRILGLGDNDTIDGFRSIAADRELVAWDRQTEVPREIAHLIRRNVVPSHDASDNDPALDALALSRPQDRNAFAMESGRRRALCIGIDDYPQSPLAGCIADANLWAKLLVDLGFEPPTILTDGAATRSGILAALNQLINSSQAGDVVVFQYSGHGTELPDENGDEQGSDQAICPYDYADGLFVIDDDIAQIFANTPPGVNVTCFIDCCHSGTISRFAVGAQSLAARAINSRKRYLRPTLAQIQAHFDFRRNQRRGRALLNMAPRGEDLMREVVFSACESYEVAYETDGQGDFTKNVVAILQGGFAGLTHQTLNDAIKQSFGNAPRQHPILDCAPSAMRATLLQPYAALFTPTPAPQPQPQPGGGNRPAGNGVALGQITVAELLESLLALVRNK